MKTFRELISWELEQDQKANRPLHITTEEAAGKLSSCVLRKLRHLSGNAASSSKSLGASFTPAG